MRRLFEIGYVAAIASLTTFATSDPNHFRSGPWVAAIVLRRSAFSLRALTTGPRPGDAIVLRLS